MAQLRLCWELGSLGCPPVQMQGHILKHKAFDLRVGLHQGLCSSDPLPSPSGNQLGTGPTLGQGHSLSEDLG